MNWKALALAIVASVGTGLALTVRPAASQSTSSVVCGDFPAGAEKKVEAWMNEQSSAGRVRFVSWGTTVMCSW